MVGGRMYRLSSARATCCRILGVLIYATTILTTSISTCHFSQLQISFFMLARSAFVEARWGYFIKQICMYCFGKNGKRLERACFIFFRSTPVVGRNIYAYLCTFPFQFSPRKPDQGLVAVVADLLRKSSFFLITNLVFVQTRNAQDVFEDRNSVISGVGRQRPSCAPSKDRTTSMIHR